MSRATAGPLLSHDSIFGVEKNVNQFGADTEGQVMAGDREHWRSYYRFVSNHSD